MRSYINNQFRKVPAYTHIRKGERAQLAVNKKPEFQLPNQVETPLEIKTQRWSPLVILIMSLVYYKSRNGATCS